MNDQQRANLALNLSYVLHERSDSATVRQYIKSAETEQRRCARAIRDLATMSDAELLRRLVILERRGELPTFEPGGVQIVSVNLGAAELFPRLLHVANMAKPDVPTFGSLLDGTPIVDNERLPFFGAPASLSMPPVPSTFSGRRLFATAVLRPGYETILLQVTALNDDPTNGGPDWQAAAQLAEQAIREFPLQWWCTRPLWSRPVEEALPEFRAAENGPATCGR